MKSTRNKTTTIFVLKEDFYTGEKEGEFIVVDLEETKNVVLKFIETGTNLRQIVIAAGKKEADKFFKKYKDYNLKEKKLETKYE